MITKIIVLRVTQCIEDFEQYLIRGDFNLVLDQYPDTKIYLHINHPKAKKKATHQYWKTLKPWI